MEENEEAGKAQDESTPQAAIAFAVGPMGHPQRMRAAMCPNRVCVNYERWYPGCVTLVMDDDWEWVLGWYRCIRCQTVFEHELKRWIDVIDKQERI